LPRLQTGQIGPLIGSLPAICICPAGWYEYPARLAPTNCTAPSAWAPTGLLCRAVPQTSQIVATSGFTFPHTEQIRAISVFYTYEAPGLLRELGLTVCPLRIITYYELRPGHAPGHAFPNPAVALAFVLRSVFLLRSRPTLRRCSSVVPPRPVPLRQAPFHLP
jgi:hypothetical protein